MNEQGIATLQEAMASNATTSRRLVEACLGRIERIDKREPTLRAVLEINPEAVAIAGDLDRERVQQGARGPLHGIPVLLKANIDTADRMTTTAGSLALAGAIAPEDATVAARLRAAGAVLLGKTNLSEWANFRGQRSISGWSSQGGQTRNPYVLDRSPCGSSSGSAVAVAAGHVPVAIGTETDGSIICPAHVNGIVGLKPTVGLVSRFGIIPIAHSQDTAGPMTLTVRDAATLLTVLAGPDPRDPSTASLEGDASIDYTAYLNADALCGARIGVARNLLTDHPRVDAIFERALAILRHRGAEVVDPANVEHADRFREAEFEVLLYEFKHDVEAYLERLGPAAPAQSLEEIIAFNEAHRDTVMPYFGQETLHLAHVKGSLSEPAYREALSECRRLSRTEGIDATLQHHRLDAIVAPSGGPAWLIDPVLGDQGLRGCSSPAAVAGYPHITVPAGFVGDLPVGLSFFASAFQEPRLISLAYAFEQATHARRSPVFLRTAA